MDDVNTGKPGWRVAADTPSSDGTSSSTLGSPKSYKLHQREQWSKKIDFLLACIGFSVGLGNVWRFPFLCYKNGGGAFLIPYFIAVVLGGVPMFFLEVSLGQFMSEGGIGPWKIAPLFQGIGYATAIIVFLLNCEYNIILTWAFYYIFSSFTDVLPWSTCDNPWNTENCTTFEEIKQIRANASFYSNYSTTTSANANITVETSTSKMVASVLSAMETVNGTAKSAESLLPDSVTEFWERKVLGLTSGVGEPGTIKWDLALCLLLAWIVVYICICKGIKSSGKVMYVTATSPYMFMIILLIRGVTLEGASLGLDYYLNPTWSRLADAQVWVDAGTQIFFSYSISLGTLTALGSYNKFNHNCFRDSILFATVNSFTSVLAGLVIFSILGFMANSQGVTVESVAESGPGLAFIAYPAAVAQLPVAPLWSVLFFIMIILLGLDSQFVGVEGFITACVDLHPDFLRRGRRKEIFTAFICFLCFLIGLSMVTEGGMYVFQLFDYYSASRIVLLVASMECFVIAYVYGIERFLDNLVMMFGFQPSTTFTKYFRIVAKAFWMFLTPAFTLIIFVLGCISYSELKYDRKFLTYVYPSWAIGVGWCLACVSVILIPITMVQRILVTRGTFMERLINLTTPRLRRHQLRPDEDMTRIILLEDDPYDLDQNTDELEGKCMVGEMVDMKKNAFVLGGDPYDVLNANEKQTEKLMAESETNAE